MRAHIALASGVFAFAAYLAVGCSSPPAPLPTGAWSLTFVKNTSTCVISDHNGNVGMIDPTGATTVVTDGVMNAAVMCSVTKNMDGSFSVSGNVTGTGSNLTISIMSLKPGTTQMAPVQGIVGYISPKTQNTFSSANKPCNFYFSDPHETVTPGNVFVSFDCPEVDSGMQMCGISAGVLKMSHCDGEVPAST